MASPNESQFWVIATKSDAISPKAIPEAHSMCDVKDFLPGKTQPGKIYNPSPFNKLRVGTLDSLMSLSDDLYKLDQNSDTSVNKLYKQCAELSKGDEPLIGGVKLDKYTKDLFEWDEAKFQMKTPLRELSENISSRIASIDDELKIKLAEVNNLKGLLQAAERKQQGNLMVRSLIGLVTEADVQESEWMTTVFVVVPKHSYKEWYDTYEKMVQLRAKDDTEGNEMETGASAMASSAYGVVPRSAKILAEDTEYGLFSVICFKTSAEAFKAAAREKRFTVREFKFVEEAVEKESTEKKSNEAEHARLQSLLKNWCDINLGEVFSMALHLKAIRIFVESVLRYGLQPTWNGTTGAMAPNFKAYIIVPKRGKAEALRKVLASTYGGSAAMVDELGEGESAVPGAPHEFYPYVSVNVETAPVITS